MSEESNKVIIEELSSLDQQYIKLLELEVAELRKDQADRRERQEKLDKLAAEHDAIWADYVRNITATNERICRSLDRIVVALEDISDRKSWLRKFLG